MKVLLKIFYNSYMILLKENKTIKKVVINKCSKYLNVVIIDVVIIFVIIISLYFTSNK